MTPTAAISLPKNQKKRTQRNADLNEFAESLLRAMNQIPYPAASAGVASRDL
jgi:hypothetical protein